MKFIKENWKMLLLIGIVAFLFWVMLRGCHSTDNSAIYREADSLKVELARNKKEYKLLQDSIAKKHIEDSIAKAKLSEGLRYTKKQLADAVDETNYYITIAERLKKRLDTIGYVVYCDSIIIENKSLQFSVANVQQQYEEVVLQLYKEKAYSDSMAAKKDILYYDLSRSSDLLLLNNYTLTQRFKKAEKGRKFNKTLNRVLAAAVLVLGGIVATK